MSGRRIRLAVVGGGSTYTPELADGIARLGTSLPVEELVLVDPDPARIEVVLGPLARHRSPEGGGNRHGIAAEAERHGHDHLRRRGAEAEIAGDRHRRKDMGDIEVADCKPVADRCPGALAHQREFDRLCFGKALLPGYDEQGAV